MIVQPGYWDDWGVCRKRGKLHVTDERAVITTCGKQVKDDWHIEDCFSYIRDLRKKKRCKRCFHL